jgi:hypothetical protein
MDKSRSGGGAARVPKRRHGRVIVGGPSSRAVPPPQNASARGKARPPTVRCADGANKESEDKDSDDDDSDYHDCDGEDSDSSDSDSSDSDDEDSEDSDSGDGAAEAGAEASANNGAEDGANNGAEDGADDGAGGGGGGGDGPPLRKRQTLALREIKHYQQSTKPLIAKAPFERVVRAVHLHRVEDRTCTCPYACTCTRTWTPYTRNCAAGPRGGEGVHVRRGQVRVDA